METIALDRYVIDTLMRDLVGHDRQPSAYLIYLHQPMFSYSGNTGTGGTRTRRRRRGQATHKVSLTARNEIDAKLERLLRTAYDQDGRRQRQTPEGVACDASMQ